MNTIQLLQSKIDGIFRSENFRTPEHFRSAENKVALQLLRRIVAHVYNSENQ